MNQEEFGREILVRWHTQFAENQRIREQSFLKILGFLGAVIFSYSYIFANYSGSENFLIFNLTSIGAMILITFGAWQIITISYNFRRDQYVNAKIRASAKIIGDNEIFPNSFDPYVSLIETDRKKYFDWIPEFLKPYYFIFPIFQILLLFSYVIKMIETGSNNWWYVVFAFLFFLLYKTAKLPVLYYNKLIKKYNEYGKIQT